MEVLYLFERVEGEHKGMKALFKPGIYSEKPGLVLVEIIKKGKYENTFCSHCVDVSKLKLGRVGENVITKLTKEENPEYFL